MAKKAGQTIWMRLGDSGEYEDKGDPYSAGYEIGMILAAGGHGVQAAETVRWRELGNDAQDAEPLSASDKKEVISGIYEGGDFQAPVKRTTTRVKKKKNSRATTPPRMQGIQGGSI